MTDRHPNQSWPLSRLVRSRRKELDLTERELSERCGWDEHFGPEDVRSLETGELTFPSTSQLEDLAAGLELDVADLEDAIEASLEEASRSQFRTMATIRQGSGRTFRQSPPKDLRSEEDIIEWASRLSRDQGEPVLLRLDDDRVVQIAPDGTKSMHTAGQDD